MFNNMFGSGDCGGGGGGGKDCGICNCTWIILILLFCCCGGKLKNFTLNINTCCLILLVGLLFCTGGISFAKPC